MRLKNGVRVYEVNDIVILHDRPVAPGGVQCFDKQMRFPRRGIILATHSPTVTLGLLSDFNKNQVTMQRVVMADSLQFNSDFISL